MKATCEHCKELDILALLDDDPDHETESTSKKLIRYYCNNTQTQNSYCPNCGQKEKCWFHKQE